MRYKSAMQGFRYKETELQTWNLEFDKFYDGFITAIKHINGTGETCGDLSPQCEFTRHLQKFKDELEFQNYLDSTNPPDEIREWFWE